MVFAPSRELSLRSDSNQDPEPRSIFHSCYDKLLRRSRATIQLGNPRFLSGRRSRRVQSRHALLPGTDLNEGSYTPKNYRRKNVPPTGRTSIQPSCTLSTDYYKYAGAWTAPQGSTAIKSLDPPPRGTNKRVSPFTTYMPDWPPPVAPPSKLLTSGDHLAMHYCWGTCTGEQNRPSLEVGLWLLLALSNSTDDPRSWVAYPLRS